VHEGGSLAVVRLDHQLVRQVSGIEQTGTTHSLPDGFRAVQETARFAGWRHRGPMCPID
jgi:hypothetical protein